VRPYKVIILVMNKMDKKLLRQSSILLVDDNPITREKIKSFLVLYTNHIYEASNGLEAIEIFHKCNPTIIISDVLMPEINGLKLTQTIRDLNQNTPIIIISTTSKESFLFDFMSLNLTDFILKPIDIEQLKKALSKCAKIIEEKDLDKIQIGPDSYYSFSKKCIRSKEKSIQLTPKEVLLIELLLKNKNILVSKEQIEQEVYGFDIMTSSALNNLIYRLREKIGNSKYLLSNSSVGLIFIIEDKYK